MPDISATTPVSEPSKPAITYDKWFLTQLIVKSSPDSCPSIVHLRRSAVVDGKTVLMPNTTEDSEVSFNLDVFKEMGATPELATALNSVLTAVVAYGTKKKLL